MAEYEEQARQELARTFALKSTKTYNAAGLYMQAGNVHKAAGSWHAAGTAYAAAGDLYLTLDYEMDKNTGHHAYEAACAMFLKSSNAEDHDRVLDLYERVLIPSRILSTVPTSSAYIAGVYKQLALMLEGDGNHGAALRKWQQAVGALEGATPAFPSAMVEALTHAAWLQALQFSNYVEAATAFERAGTISTGTPLLRYNACVHFANALFCTLAAGDSVLTEKNLQRFAEADAAGMGPEASAGKALAGMVAAYRACDQEAFCTHVAVFDAHVHRLEDQQTQLLTRIRTRLVVVDLS